MEKILLKINNTAILKVVLELFAAIENTEICIRNGLHTSYKLRTDKHNGNQLYCVGFERTLVDAFDLLEGENGVIVYKPFKGDVQHKLIINNNEVNIFIEYR